MKEEQLLDQTLEVLDRQGADEAYSYLVDGVALLDSRTVPGAQVYNFLYCLAAVSGRREEALGWMQEAIVERQYWYRPEVFDDDDLESLRSDPLFEQLVNVSEARYREAVRAARTLCTWESVRSDKLVLVLHGNQQNYSYGRGYWEQLSERGYQVEYVQSATPDSAGLYRWDSEAELQLGKVLAELPLRSYEALVLGGFSAGCNEILRMLLDHRSHDTMHEIAPDNNLNNERICDRLILVAPWIPVIDDRLAALLDIMESEHIEVCIVCGKEDADCAPLVERFSAAAEHRDIELRVDWVEGLGHAYP